MRTTVLILLLLSLLIICACAPAQETVKATEETEPLGTEEVASQEVAPRSPLFVYNNQASKSPAEFTLSINASPLLLPDGYVRLVGVVSGGNPLALIEVGGRGLCLQLGETFSGYQVAVIDQREIKLVKKEKL